MQNDRIIEHINNRIKLLIDKYGIDDLPEIAIIPFGKNGMMAKQILNMQYGIRESYIVDSVYSKYNADIITVDDLLSMAKNNKLCAILTTTKADINDILLNRLKRSNIEVINIMDFHTVLNDEKAEYFRELYDMLRVKAVKNMNFTRVGRDYDGGYIMLDDFDDSMKVYSFGVCDDMSWDMDIHNRYGFDVYLYDHTIPTAPNYCEGCYFEKKGIGINDTKDMLSLSTILKNHQDISNRNLLIKMDIEGAEWDVIENLNSSILENFRQMVLELHGMTELSMRQKIISVLSKINEIHQLVWIHGNNYGQAEIAKGLLMPDSIEVLYARKDSYVFSDEAVNLPLQFDMPNDPIIKDFNFNPNSILWDNMG